MRIFARLSYSAQSIQAVFHAQAIAAPGLGCVAFVFILVIALRQERVFECSNNVSLVATFKFMNPGKPILGMERGRRSSSNDIRR